RSRRKVQLRGGPEDRPGSPARARPPSSRRYWRPAPSPAGRPASPEHRDLAGITVDTHSRPVGNALPRLACPDHTRNPVLAPAAAGLRNGAFDAARVARAMRAAAGGNPDRAGGGGGVPITDGASLEPWAARYADRFASSSAEGPSSAPESSARISPMLASTK